MKKKNLAIIVISLILCNNTYAQNAIIKGQVVDSSVNVNLKNASVVLLQAKDSFIVADARADANGKFSFSNISDTANYVLFFSYPKYADYSHKINMKDAVKGVLDMYKISLIQKEKLLQEVIVKSQVSAIRIKGDTTEYIADSFKVQANATVEDLLKQLPGLQVDQYGNITAQGQKVKKVLVDGEEFFSDDPTLVTRNLRADMIDKVQVFDKKSDAAAFTGIDDGVRDKTINLKIKEDKNHGIFGKADMGAGTDDHYNAQGMLNAFKGKRKMAVYGTTSNIGRTGLGAADKQKIGDDEKGDGNYDGKGLPKVTSGGVHYDKKWNEDKNDINGNYKLNISDIQGVDNTISQNNLPTGTLLNNTNSNFDNRNTTHRANATYTRKFDTTSTFKVYTDGYLSNSKNLNNSNSESRRGSNNSLINDNSSSSSNNYNNNIYNLNLSWQKKLKKYGRTISFYFNNNFANDDANGESRSDTRFYNQQNNLDSTAPLHLKKRMSDNWNTQNFTANYTEPLTSKLSLLLNYELNNNNTHDDKRSFNIIKDPSGNLLDTAFSSIINSNTLSNGGGVALNYNIKKMIFKIGNDVKAVSMDINDKLLGDKYNKNFLNWNPSFSYQYNKSQFSAFYFEYKGNSTNPGRTQLVPFAYNNGQLSTYLSNIDLKNSFTHAFNSYFYKVKGLGTTYMSANASYNIISNPIALSSTLLPSGAYIYRYENISGHANSNYMLNLVYGKQIAKWETRSYGYGNINGGNAYSTINDALNKLNYNTYTLGGGLYKSKLKKYEFALNVSGGYTSNKSSLQPELKNNYFFYTANPSADVYFLKKFQIHTDATYFWQQKTQTFNDNFDRTIWNAWLGRNFFKNDQLLIKISCNDILNENNGYSRTANNTLFTENRYTTIRRFFMLSAVWNFTKFNNIKQ